MPDDDAKIAQLVRERAPPEGAPPSPKSNSPNSSDVILTTAAVNLKVWDENAADPRSFLLTLGRSGHIPNSNRLDP